MRGPGDRIGGGTDHHGGASGVRHGDGAEVINGIRKGTSITECKDGRKFKVGKKERSSQSRTSSGRQAPLLPYQAPRTTRRQRGQWAHCIPVLTTPLAFTG